MQIQVAAYHIRVKEKGKQKKFEMLDSINHSHDFFEFAHAALKKCRSSHHDDKTENRVAKVENVEVKDRAIQGRVQVGDYGQACDVIDTAQEAKVVFSKTVSHADLLPFFFRIEVPENRDEALFLIEKSRRTSPKTAFTRLLKDQFDARFPEFTISIEPVMPQDVFREYLEKGSVQKLEFIKMGLPNDITDILDGGHDQKHVVTKFVVTAARKDSLPVKKKILKADNPAKEISDLYEIPGFEYQDVSVTMRIGKNTRKVDLRSGHALPLYDITLSVVVGKDGIGTYQTMAAAFESLASDINEGAYATA